MSDSDVYITLAAPSSEVLYKDKNSKFFGYAFPVQREEDVKEYLEQLRSKHKSAGHFCYAWQLGTTISELRYRVNDDGEPSHSAGTPIYHQIQSQQITEVLVVVVRYFGGVKLGVPGLIQAYKTTAALALDASEIIEKIKWVHFEVRCDYHNLNHVMRVVKEKNLLMVHQEMYHNCKVILATRKSEAEILPLYFAAFHEVTCTMVDFSIQ